MLSNKKTYLKRIVFNPNIMVGKPVIKGTRLTVQYILDLLSQGMTQQEVLEEYDNLEKDDILARLAYADEA